MERNIKFEIPIARPSFTGREGAAIQELLDRGWVSQGPAVEQFEQAIAAYTGAQFAVATTSCTSALHLSMLVNDIGPGDDVICPSYSFIATANAIRHCGANPQFVDIDIDTLNLDGRMTEAFIQARYDCPADSTPSHGPSQGPSHTGPLNKETGSQLKAILLVHQLGIAADVDQFKGLCTRYGIALIEDSACGIGSSYKGINLGGTGNISAFSFHPRKVITTGEGGMVLTNEPSIAERARSLRSHGASLSDYLRHHSVGTTYEAYEEVGYNYRMTDIQATIGLAQLELLDWFLQRRQQIASTYDKAFANVEELAIIAPPAYQTSWNRQSYPLRLLNLSSPDVLAALGSRATNNACADRDQLMQYLQSKGISVRRGIPAIHCEPAYREATRSQRCLPNTEIVSSTSLFLPIFPTITDEEVEHVIECVLEGAKRLNRKVDANAIAKSKA